VDVPIFLCLIQQREKTRENELGVQFVCKSKHWTGVWDALAYLTCDKTDLHPIVLAV
jgi:hypothetical protein